MARRRLRITGIQETIRKLDQLDKRTRKTILAKGTRAGGTVMVKGVRSRVPKVNRGLRKSMLQVLRRYDTGALSVVGQDLAKVRRAGTNAKKRLRGGGISGRGDTVPIHLVEQKTRAHAVPGLHVYRTGRGRGTRVVFYQDQQHPGTRAQEPVSRTYVIEGNRALKTMETKIIIEFNRTVDKVKAT